MKTPEAEFETVQEIVFIRALRAFLCVELALPFQNRSAGTLSSRGIRSRGISRRGIFPNRKGRSNYSFSFFLPMELQGADLPYVLNWGAYDFRHHSKRLQLRNHINLHRFH